MIPPCSLTLASCAVKFFNATNNRVHKDVCFTSFAPESVQVMDTKGGIMSLKLDLKGDKVP